MIGTSQVTGISPQAIIDPSAKIGNDVSIGPWTYIGPNVEVGDGCQIASHVVIHCNTKLGQRNKIYPFASIGGDPQDIHYAGEPTYLEMGDDNIVRESVTLNRGSANGTGVTRIGNKNCFLAYSHVAHDCTIGNEVLFVNNCCVAGHVTVEDYVIMGAFTAVHQFCVIGAYSFLSRATEVSKDVPPFMLVKGIPGAPCGLNTVGLRRRGFTDANMSALKKAYQIMYRRGLKMEEVKKELKIMAAVEPKVQMILDLLMRSERGIAREMAEV